MEAGRQNPEADDQCVLDNDVVLRRIEEENDGYDDDNKDNEKE